MLKLSDREWKEFKVGDLFTIVTGKVTKIDRDGTLYPIVQACTTNNAIVGYSDEDTHVTSGGKLTIGQQTAYCQYQEHDFIATNNVLVLFNDKDIKRNTGLFLSTVINHSIAGKFNYGRKLSAGRSTDVIIQIPVDSNGQPDYDFMEQYIREREPDYSWATGCVKSDAQLNLSDRQWKEFNLGDLFKVEQGKGKIDKDTLSSNNTGYKIATASTTSNGIIWSNAEQDAKVRAGNTITIGRQTGVAFYQPDKYFETDNILILTNSSINKWSGLFIAGSYNSSTAQKFSYGRVVSIGKIKAESIKLPADDQGQPDYGFMERYMKSLPFSAAVA